ncbi:MAG: PAS domain S-box protein [Sulfuricellaceae bacterium]|jgi:PAS domain S-box-containing protein
MTEQETARVPFGRRSIKWRMALVVALVISLLSAVGVTFHVWEEGRALERGQLAQAEALSRTLAVNSVSWVLADDVAGLGEVVQSLSHYPELRYAMVVSPSGRVLAHSLVGMTGKQVIDPASLALLNSPAMPQIVANDRESVDVAVPVLAGGRLLAWARVALKKDSIYASQKKMAREGALFVAAAVMVSILLGVGLSSRITRDIGTLSEVAELIRRGRRDVRVTFSRDDEIGRLGEDLNAMLDTLAAKERNLLDAQQIAHLGHWELDLATNKLHWSEEVFRIFEIDPARFPASYEAFMGGVHPDDREKVDRAYRLSIENHAPYKVVHRLLFPDGRVKYVQERGITQFDGKGVPMRSLGTIQDITERVLIEQRLEKEMLRYRTLLRTMRDGLCVLDENGKVVEANRAFADMLGYSEAEIASLSVSDWNAQWDREGALAKVGQLMARSEAFETLHRRKDGTTYPAEVSATPMVIEGRPLLFSVIRDISERKRAEEALRALNASLEERVREEVEKSMRQERTLIQQSRLAALGELVHHISHHWRQPLNALGLVLANIEDAYRFNELDAAALHDYVRRGNALLQGMSATIDNFRNFFQPDSGLQPVDVGKAVREVVDLVGESYRSADVAVSVAGEESAMAEIYPNEFFQVLLNLLTNSREAIRSRGVEQGRVTISLHAAEGKLTVRVEDNGGGISDAVAERIFDPYFTTKENGTGLGLYIARTILEKMGGKIAVANGEAGLRVDVTLPLLPA